MSLTASHVLSSDKVLSSSLSLVKFFQFSFLPKFSDFSFSFLFDFLGALFITDCFLHYLQHSHFTMRSPQSSTHLPIDFTGNELDRRVQPSPPPPLEPRRNQGLSSIEREGSSVPKGSIRVNIQARAGILGRIPACGMAHRRDRRNPLMIRSRLQPVSHPLSMSKSNKKRRRGKREKQRAHPIATPRSIS